LAMCGRLALYVGANNQLNQILDLRGFENL
jgi:hypothetical protein